MIIDVNVPLIFWRGPSSESPRTSPTSSVPPWKKERKQTNKQQQQQQQQQKQGKRCFVILLLYTLSNRTLLYTFLLGPHAPSRKWTRFLFRIIVYWVVDFRSYPICPKCSKMSSGEQGNVGEWSVLCFPFSMDCLSLNALISRTDACAGRGKI